MVAHGAEVLEAGAGGHGHALLLGVPAFVPVAESAVVWKF